MAIGMGRQRDDSSYRMISLSASSIHILAIL